MPYVIWDATVLLVSMVHDTYGVYSDRQTDRDGRTDRQLVYSS